MDKIYVSSTATQTEQLTSPILWHCLHIVKSVPEFRNLSYRVSADMNGNELLIVYRDQVTRVFGPPVEPISLTLDPFGKCLVSIPFRPIQRVPVTNPKTGHLDLMSLHALFHMVAGKGFYFCPGIPEKFLTGKACGKYIVMHRAPFKRFNAVGCVVYFQIPKTKALNTGKESQLIRTLCPRCRQFAQWAQTLPVTPNPTTRPQIVNPVLLNQVPRQVPVDMKSGNPSTNKLDMSMMNDNAVNGVNPEQEIASKSVDPKKDGIPLTVLDQTKTGFNTNSSNVVLHTSGVKSSPGGASNLSRRRGMDNEKLQAVSESLRLLLRQRTMSKDSLIESALKYKLEGSGQNRGDKLPGSDNPRSPRVEKARKNVCRICHKQFSSNLRLSKHVQRHEGNGHNLSKILRRKISRQNASAIFLSRLFRRNSIRSALSSNGDRRNTIIPNSSLQLVIKSIYDILGDKKLGEDANTAKNTQEKKRKTGKRKRGQQSPQPNIESAPSRPGLRRSGSGLAAVQTLLSAAQLAEIDQSNSVSNVNNLSIQGSHINNFLPVVASPSGNRKESYTEHIVTGLERASQAKKARTSLRLATKRAKKSKTPDLEDLSMQGGPDTPSDEAIMMTNLDLLSTVSLQAELRDNQASPGNQLLSYAGNPDSKLHNTSHASKVIEHNALPQLASSSFSTLFSTTPSSTHIQSHRTKSNSGASIFSHQQIPVTDVPKQNARSNMNKLPPLPPLILGTDSILIGQPPHSSSLSSMHLPSSIAVSLPFPLAVPAQGHIVPKGLGSASSSIDFIAQEEVACMGFSCEAMDLTKPKSSPSVDTGSSGRVSPISQDSTDVLRQFLMINPITMPQKPPVRTTPAPDLASLVSTKEADDSLQARMFASAKNYKVDSNKQPTGQVQAVISSSTPPSAVAKEKDKIANEKSEIQCGYKWSGSGGLVKERTQLVRELVPSVVMANILNGPVSNSGLPKMDDPISAPVQNITKLRGSQKQQLQQNLTQSARLSPQTSQTSPSHPPTGPISPVTPQYVLNLSKHRKEPETQHRFPSSSQLSVKPPPASLHASILRTSLLNTAQILPTSISSQKQSIPGSSNTNPSGNWHASKTSVLTLPPNTVQTSSSTMLSSVSQPIPNSSSLAAMLRHSQKNSTSILSTNSPNENYSITISPSVVPIISNMVSNNLEVTEIKTEPPDIFENSVQLTGLPTVIPTSLGALIKNEDRITEAQSSTDRDLSTPPNLVVDMGTDKIMVLPVTGGKSNKKFKSSKGKVSTVSCPLKCEFCSLLFHSTKDHACHVCPQKPR